jgi:hypothetical protein
MVFFCVCVVVKTNGERGGDSERSHTQNGLGVDVGTEEHDHPGHNITKHHEYPRTGRI